MKNYHLKAVKDWEIARNIGFDNVSHFINTFKKQEQVTPLSFRKQWRSPQ